MIEILSKVFAILLDTKHLRFVLGLFFIAVAMTGAIEIISDNSRYLDVYENRPVNLTPIYYAACLFAGCWLSFGNQKSEDTDEFKLEQFEDKLE